MSDAIYFLDAQVAQNHAKGLIDQAVDQDKTLAEVTLCYYHANTAIDSDLLNCVWLPLETVYDFFRYSHLPLPQQIDFTGSLSFLEQDADFNLEFNNILAQTQQYRDQLLRLYTASPLNRDALFIDAQIALLTAVKEYRATNNGIANKQRCYYLGKKLSVNLENLIHLDLDHYVSFFASSIYPVPRIIVPSTNMTLDDSIAFEQKLVALNSLVSRHQCVGCDL